MRAMRLRANATSSLVLLIMLGCGPGRGPAAGDSSCDGGDCTDAGQALDGGEPVDGGDGLGSTCARNSDCPSHLCLPQDGGSGICTRVCEDDSLCLAGWECDPFAGQRICQCSPAPETCDGLDNDCNGIVDDSSATDPLCRQSAGEGTVCVAGHCAIAACTTNDDCQLGQRCDTGTRQCVANVGVIRICPLTPNSGAVDTARCFPGAAVPPTIEFGDLAIGDETTRTLRIFNDGLGVLNVAGAHIESSVPDFTVVGGAASPAINPGAFVDLQIRYTASISGSETGRLIIPSSDGTNPSVIVTLHGAAQGPELCITPNPLAFGVIPRGSSRTLQITLTNCGNTDYNITQLAFINDDPGTSVFTTSRGGVAPFSFPTGASMTIDVTYTPIYIETPPAGDSGYFSIKTDYQRATVPVTGSGGFPTCDVEGQNFAPTAAIVVTDGTRVIAPATETVAPLSTLTLDGTSSTAPPPNAITQYRWRLVSQPSGGMAQITGSGSSVMLRSLQAGDYTVELTVGTSDRCQSVPVSVTLHVAPMAAIYVQLTWPEAYGDMDLHYVGPGGTFYQEANPVSDIDWAHSLATASGTGPPTANGLQIADFWGLNNTCSPNGTTSDDATMDVDQRNGYGPETVTHNQPFDGTYSVYVHYYCNGAGTTTRPKVRIFVNGAVAWSGEMANMSKGQVWQVAQIVVSNSGTSIEVVPQTMPLFIDPHGC